MQPNVDRITGIRDALTDLVRETGRSLKHTAAAVAYFAEAQRMQVERVFVADEPGLEDAARHALGAVKLYAGVEAVDEADEAARRFRERAVAILEVALRVGGAAAAGVV